MKASSKQSMPNLPLSGSIVKRARYDFDGQRNERERLERWGYAWQFLCHFFDEIVASSAKLPELAEQMKITKEDVKFCIFSRFETVVWLVARVC